MNYIVISDSHGDFSNIELLLKKYPDYTFIHCGDFTKDLDKLIKNKIIFVRGNCDTEGELSKLISTEYGDFFITHGHEYDVKFQFERLYFKAASLDAKYILFGHTHVPYVEEVNNRWFINPGSIRDSKTYVVIKDGVPKLYKI